MVRKWLILISGYRQSYERMTGMDRLFIQVLEKGYRVEYWPWNSDWEGNAAFIHRHSPQEVEIIVAAYSWGGGHGAVKLSEQLRDRGRLIHHMILCDPVYRASWAPSWFNLLPMSMTKDRTIRYPSTVEQIDWFYQRIDKPAGHKPIGARVVSAGTELTYTHSGIDDSGEFHATVLEAIS